MKKIRNVCTGVLLGLVTTVAFAADYPSRPITFLTMTQPGAQIDQLTRGLGQRMSKSLGQPVNVKNVTGSHGTVMATELSKADPDGYTIGVTSLTAYTYAPHHTKLNYSPDDFDYLSLIAINASGFIANKDKPYNTLKEAFDWHKKNNKAMVAMFHGADDRDAITRIAKAEGVPLSLIPSKGGPSVIQAVTGGHADVGYVGAILYKHVQAGTIKLLASALGERLPPLPEVPTLREQGYDEQVEMIVAFVARKGMDKSVKDKLLASIDGLTQDKDTNEFITGKLLMRPVKWGEPVADKTVKELNATFAKQAGKK